MNLEYLVKDYADYNYWANKRLIDWLKTKPVEKMDVEVPSSFTSIRLTFIHIWNVQKYWLSNLQKLQPEPRSTDFTTEEVFDGVLKQSEVLAKFISSLSEEALLANYDFTIQKVNNFTCTGFKMIQHCMNHSAYHRGQIVTIARNVGLTDAPMSDYIYYSLMPH